MKKEYSRPMAEVKAPRIRTSILAGSGSTKRAHVNPREDLGYHNIPISNQPITDPGKNGGFDARERSFPFN